MNSIARVFVSISCNSQNTYLLEYLWMVVSELIKFRYLTWYQSQVPNDEPINLRAIINLNPVNLRAYKFEDYRFLSRVKEFFLLSTINVTYSK